MANANHARIPTQSALTQQTWPTVKPAYSARQAHNHCSIFTSAVQYPPTALSCSIVTAHVRLPAANHGHYSATASEQSKESFPSAPHRHKTFREYPHAAVIRCTHGRPRWLSLATPRYPYEYSTRPMMKLQFLHSSMSRAAVIRLRDALPVAP